jgi:adenylate cyclase
MTSRYRRTYIFLAVIILSLLLHTLPIAKQLLGILQLRTYDLILDLVNAFADNDSKPKIEEIVIVDIDEESISRLGQFSKWPNLYFADLVDSLANDEPILIAFDMFFTESDSLNAYGRQRMGQHFAARGLAADQVLAHYTSDREFAAAIARAGNVYLGMFNSSSPLDSVYLPSTLSTWQVSGNKAQAISNPKAPLPLLAEAAYGVGLAHIEPDISGVIHDYPLFFRFGDELLVNFSFQACLDLLGIDKILQKRALHLLRDGEIVGTIPLNSRQELFFNYYGKSRRFRYVSFSDVLLGRIPHPFFEGKIVLVGSSAAGLRDIKTTPLDADYPGVELHATLMMNVLTGDYVRWLPLWGSWLIAAILLLLLASCIRYLRPLHCLIIYLTASLLLFSAFIYSFAASRLSMDYSVFILTWVLGYFSLLVNEYQLQYAEKKKVRNAFEHFVPKSVISQIMKVNDPLCVGGVRKTASILFSDIRDFSSICEKIPAEEVSDFLHKHFNECTDVVMQNKGTLDKYIGDALLALYNVPIAQATYQLDACKTAVGIIQKADALRAEYAAHPVLSSFKIGVGIATGEIIAGNFGSDEIFNYTGIGDKMNLASRLEGLNKNYHSSIIIDAATHEAVHDHYLCRRLDRVCVKGKGEAVDIFELLAPIYMATEQQNRLCELYNTGLQAMVESNKDLAQTAFEQCQRAFPEDYPTRLMLARLAAIDWSTWDGVFRHNTK